MLIVNFDEKDLYKTQASLNATNREIANAARRAVNKTLTWIAGARREIAKESNIPLKTLKHRVYTTKAVDALHGSVWFGTAPIKAIYAGNARQTRSGVVVHGHSFPGAFIARVPTGHVGIFKRVGLSRLPIKEQTIDLNPGIKSLQRVAEQAPARFRALFDHELQYEINVRGG